MYNIFLEVLNNSVSTVLLIIAVIFGRLLIRKAPKFITCILWVLVGIKLICPVSIESMFSLVPDISPLTNGVENAAVPHISSTVSVVDDVVKPVLSNEQGVNETASVNSGLSVMGVVMWIWIAGLLALCIYSIVTYIILKRKVAVSQRICKNVYVCDDISTPFIMGIVRKGIYLPTGLDEETIECVLEHEKSHIKRLDYLWKPLGFLILAVHWFNPLCWIAYILFCRDIELACDEKVIRNKEVEWKAMYCNALLECNKRNRIVAVCPVAFGEVGVKERVKAVINYKKPSFWLVAAAIAISIFVAVCFMTSSGEKNKEKDNKEYDIEAALFNDTAGIQSSKMNSEVTLGEFTDDMFMYFGGCLYECSEYKEPVHSEMTPESWYSLGGVGVCQDPEYMEHETFDNGKLVAYDILGNYFGYDKVLEFETKELSGCLYRYRLDISVGSEKGAVSTAEYLVAFFTGGEGEPLYMRFFNCDYYSQEDVFSSLGY